MKLHDALHTHRRLLIDGLVVAGVGALVAGVIATLESGNPALPRSSGAPRTANLMPTPSAQAAIAATPTVAACASEPNLTFSIGAQRRLDLGARALFVANHGAVVAATQSATCDLRAALADGSLAIHARDLSGRTLVVSTVRGDMRVKGTMFLVDFYAASGELEVGVEEGQVELVTREGKSVTLGAGQAAYLGSHIELEPFDDSDRGRLRHMLGLGGKRSRAVEREARAENEEQE